MQCNRNTFYFFPAKFHATTLNAINNVRKDMSDLKDLIATLTDDILAIKDFSKAAADRTTASKNGEEDAELLGLPWAGIDDVYRVFLKSEKVQAVERLMKSPKISSHTAHVVRSIFNFFFTDNLSQCLMLKPA